MFIIPKLSNEKERQLALQQYHILDTAGEQDFDDITDLASAICGTPIALISFVDEHRQWFKSHTGLNMNETDKAYSFCAHAIASTNEIMVVEDAREDERFKNNPFVTGEAHITFYAGVPLTNDNGYALGTLCVVDRDKRTLTDSQVKALKTLARQVMDKLELRRKLLELEEANKQINQLHEKSLADQLQLKLVLDTMAEGVSIFDAEGKVIYVNKLTEQMFGLSQQQFTNRIYNDAKWLNLRMDGTVLPEYEHPKSITLATGKPVYNFELAIQQTGKTAFYLLMNTAPLFNNEGEIMGGISTFMDITESRKLTERLILSEANLRLTVEAANMGIGKLNIGTREVDLDVRCRKTFGLPSEGILTTDDVFATLSDQYLPIVKEALDKAINQNSLLDVQFQIVKPQTQEPCWLRIVGKSISDYNKDAKWFYVVVMDVSEQKHQEQKKDDFISIASHELKTPITSLKASLQLMDKIKDNPSHHMLPRLIMQSRKSAERVGVLIDDLLNVGRLQQNNLNLNKSTFILSQLLNACASPISIMGKHKFEITGELELEVDADEHRIDQVITNMINNAVKYAPDSPIIKLTIEKHSNMAKVSVTDYGPGIPPEKLAHLFDRYYRVDSSGSQASGLGLGLYISSEIVRKHGGIIGVESELGTGTTFYFTLPL